MRLYKSLVVPFFIVLNVAVYIMWTVNYGSSADFMALNFTVSWWSLTQGYYWTLITSVFSHNMIWHLAFNMIALKSFGTIIEQIIGPWRFFKFYIIAGVISSLSHALVSAFVMNSADTMALGASGSVSGLILVFSLMFPKERLSIFGIIPIPAMFGALLFVGLDIWGLFAQAKGGGLPIGHGAHLGGALTGAIYYFVYLRPRLRQFDAAENVIS